MNSVKATPETARPWPRIDAMRVHALLGEGSELAFLDVREEGLFNTGHPLTIVSMPFSHLEMRIAALVPRRTTRIVLMDQSDDGLAERAAQRLAGWGYIDISILKDGLEGWRKAGLEVFAGIYVPSKAFGEFVEHRYDTPAIDAEELRRWIDQGKDMVILDSRPYSEFHNYSLPGGIDCPGAELVYRVFDLVERQETTIVVNCAGRTRGIIGAQSLINAGIGNPVVCVRNGTAGWHLSGETMARGSRTVAPPPTPKGLASAIEAAMRVSKRFGVREIDAAGLRNLRADAARSLYFFDVRSPEEYEAGHIPGSRSAPGGQLIQSTDHYVGTRGARIVLCDDNGVRARMTASWLNQLGWTEVFVLTGGLSACGAALEKGPEPVEILPPNDADGVERITVLELHRLLATGEAVVVDLANSLRFRSRHIPGAWFAVRSRLQDGLAQVAAGMPQAGRIVLTSDDGSFAALAAADAIAATGLPVSILDGGTAAWATAGLPLASGLENMTSETDDVWYSPYDYNDLRKSMTAYLTWEIDLIQQLEKDRSLQFRYFPPDAA
ncbi:rhodanese-like domain-containing protein [Reyranella sp.]|uniref:rhodanese-like domain-containing protein n=1 Tax=Reyranella sp. TaxID=1929291 RepID=UPI004035F52B